MFTFKILAFNNYHPNEVTLKIKAKTEEEAIKKSQNLIKRDKYNVIEIEEEEEKYIPLSPLGLFDGGR